MVTIQQAQRAIASSREKSTFLKSLTPEEFRRAKQKFFFRVAGGRGSAGLELSRKERTAVQFLSTQISASRQLFKERVGGRSAEQFAAQQAAITGQREVTITPTKTPFQQAISGETPTFEEAFERQKQISIQQQISDTSQLPMSVREQSPFDPAQFSTIQPAEERKGFVGGLQTFKTEKQTKALRGEISFPERVGLFGGALALGLISIPKRVVGLGVGLATEPVKTIKDIPAGFIEFGKQTALELRSPTPETALGTIGAEIIFFKGTGQVLKGASKGVKSVSTKLDEFGTGLKPLEFGKAQITKTPLKTTFPFELDIKGLEFKPSARQRLQLKRFQATQEKPLFTFDVEKPLTQRFDVELPKGFKPTKKPSKPITFEVERPLVDRFETILPGGFKPKKAPPKPLTFEVEKPLSTKFETILPEGFTPKKITKKTKPLTFELDQPLSTKFETILPKGFKPKKVTKKPKGITFEIERPLVDRFDTLEVGKGLQQQLLKPPKVKKIVKQKPFVLDLGKFKFQEFDVLKTRKKLKIKRVREQPLVMGVQGIQEFTRQLEKQFPATKFEAIGELQAQRFEVFQPQIQLQTTRQIQRFRKKQLFAPLIKLRERQIPQQLFAPMQKERQVTKQAQAQVQALKFGDVTALKPLQRFRQQEKTILGQRFIQLQKQFQVSKIIFDRRRKRIKIKKVKKKKKVKVPIRPSFTGIVLGIEEAPIISPTLGVVPGQIRGLETGFDVPKRKQEKRSKRIIKSSRKFLTDL